MNENRRRILEMLAAGKISAAEAERLMTAVESSNGSSSAPDASEIRRTKPKYLRVLVESEEGQPNDPSTVNIRVPMQLLRAGVKLASLIPAHARAHVNNAMRENGIPLDLSQIKPENLEEIVDQLDDLTVDVNHKKDRVKVKVYCE